VAIRTTCTLATSARKFAVVPSQANVILSETEDLRCPGELKEHSLYPNPKTEAEMSETREVFNGKDLTGWNGGPTGADHEWCVAGSVKPRADDPKLFEIEDGEGLLLNGPTGRTANIWTSSEFGDCELSVEFVVPEGSNSGIYLMGRYEIQILDSWGADELKYNTCGGIYCRWIDEKPVGGQAPRVNASRPPGEWQSYMVTFRAPVFEDGIKVQNAVFERVVWNGQVIHEGVEMKGPTRGGLEPESATGPLMLQGDHGPVAYRNIKMRDL